MITFKFAALAAIASFAALSAQNQTSSLEALAQNAVAAQDWAGARDFYTTLATQHPDNPDYFNGIGRMDGYLGNYDAAIVAYDSALSLSPKNLEAILGKANVLLWKHDYKAAAVLLNQAEQLAPESTEVGMANARRYFYQNNLKKATFYVKRVLAKSPSDPDALDLRTKLLQNGNFSLAVNLAFDNVPFSTLGVSGSVEAGWRTANYAISGRFEQWNRFGRDVSREGLSYAYTFRSGWIAGGSATVGSRGDALARWDNTAFLKRKLQHGWVVGAQYRDLIFDGSHIRMAGPVVEYYFERPIWIDVSYYRSWNTSSVAGALNVLDAPANSTLFRYHQRIGKMGFQAGYGHGVELFTIPALNQFGQLATDTYLAGIELPRAGKITPTLSYAAMRRSNDTVEQVISIGLILNTRHEP